MISQKRIWLVTIILLLGIAGATMLAQPEATDEPLCPHHNLPMSSGCCSTTPAADGQEYMPMGGVPKPLFYGGVAAVLIFSFVLFERGGGSQAETKARAPWRYNLLQIRPFRWLAGQGWLPFALQLPIALAFGYILYAGLFGHPTANIAPILTWTIWWAGLIFAILLLGKVWCLVCPWDLVASILQYVTPWRKSGRPLTLNLPWPKKMKNIYLAMGLFILLTWLELGFGVTGSPRATAYMGLGMLLLVALPAVIFEKKSFCRYGCLIGRISGLYALFSPVELRSKNKTVCDHCRTHDCYEGNENGSACPTGMTLATMTDNTYCTLCTECVRTCKKDNVAINLRPFGADLMHLSKPRLDEALLAVILLSLTAFHGLTMTNLWEDRHGAGNDVVSFIGRLFGTERGISFSIGMAAILIAPIILFVGSCYGTRWLAGNRSVSVKSIFIHFAYSLLPIALFYHLAHNGMHLFMEGQEIVPALSNPLANGSNYFGTASWEMSAWLGSTEIWVAQTFLIVLGHIIGLFISHKMAHRLYPDRGEAIRSLIPMLVIMVAFSALSMWLISLDMNMRSSMM